MAKFTNALLRFAAGDGRLELIYRAKKKGASGYTVIHLIGEHVTAEDGSRLAHIWFTEEGDYGTYSRENGSEVSRMFNKALHEQSLVKATQYDNLTGLPNMTHFFELAEPKRDAMLEQGQSPALLYIDLSGMNTPQKSGALFEQLQSLRPDVLILGGDYNSVPLLDRLNRPDRSLGDEAEALRARTDFFQYISAFQAPLGKFAIAATEDPQWQDLRQVMAQSGVQPLVNDATVIHSNGDALCLVGVCGKVSSLNDVSRHYSKYDCVVAICEGPDVLPALMLWIRFLPSNLISHVLT